MAFPEGSFCHPANFLFTREHPSGLTDSFGFRGSGQPPRVVIGPEGIQIIEPSGPSGHFNLCSDPVRGLEPDLPPPYTLHEDRYPSLYSPRAAGPHDPYDFGPYDYGLYRDPSRHMPREEAIGFLRRYRDYSVTGLMPLIPGHRKNCVCRECRHGRVWLREHNVTILDRGGRPVHIPPWFFYGPEDRGLPVPLAILDLVLEASRSDSLNSRRRPTRAYPSGRAYTPNDDSDSDEN